MFPFLIGRIRTKRFVYLFSESYTMFPFLIGRIRTQLKVESETHRKLFPFLIGRIRT